MLVDGLKMKTAVIMSEDARLDRAASTPATRPACRRSGFKSWTISASRPTPRISRRFFNKIEASKPDVIITGVSHVGTQAEPCNGRASRLPIPMFGIASQATNSTFWKDTNGATEGVIYQGVSGPGVAGHAQDAALRRRVHEKVRQYALPMPVYTAYDDVLHHRRRDQASRKQRIATSSSTPWRRPTTSATIGRVQFLPKRRSRTCMG